MPGLSYPFAFECSDCDHRTIIKRSDIPDAFRDADSYAALSVALERREWGWYEDELFCPDCASGVTAD